MITESSQQSEGFGADIRRWVIRAEWLVIDAVPVERPVKDENPKGRDPNQRGCRRRVYFGG